MPIDFPSSFNDSCCVLKQSLALEEAKKMIQTGGGAITIRQVTSMDKKLEVRDRMKKRYGYKNYPDEFSYRCKCIVVFQNLDGVDVVLFGLYVYEHDEKNPAPNKRCVYVSYLDSVHYMRPRHMRTFIYHPHLTPTHDGKVREPKEPAQHNNRQRHACDKAAQQAWARPTTTQKAQ